MVAARWLVVFALLAGGAEAAAAGTGTSEQRERVRAHLNRERSLAGLGPLAVRPVLDAAAQALASELAQGASGGATELRRQLAARGYAAESAELVKIVAAGAPETALSGLLERGGSFREVLLGGSYPDLGVGVARLGERPLYVLIFALTAVEAFDRRTAGLADREAVRESLLRETNRVRAESGRPELRRDPCLEEVAQTYAERMLAEGFFGHLSPAGDEVLERVRERGCLFGHAGENLAAGPDSARAAVAGWLDSPDHRQLLLSRDYRSVGYGVAHGDGPHGREIVWVQVVGAR